MPEMTGTELLEKLKQEPALSGIPVVISTSAPELAPKDLPVLPKPVDINVLAGWLLRECHCG